MLRAMTPLDSTRGMDAMECDCARSLIEAITGSTAAETPEPSAAGAAPLGRCLWCGEPTAEPAVEPLASLR